MIDEAHHAEVCGPLIERFLRALAEKKNHVEVTAVPSDAGINWALRCHADDVGKVVGSEGSHVRALRLVLELMGARARETWKGTVMPPVGIESLRSREERTAKTHSFQADKELLQDLLISLGVSAAVKVSGSVADGFRFEVETENMVSLAKMLDAHPAIYDTTQAQRNPLNLLGAIGTLFRSIARVQGVRYKLAVPG